jgi:hypothetical protein
MEQDVKDWLVRLSESHTELDRFTKNHITDLNQKFAAIKTDVGWVKLISIGILIAVIVNACT